MTTDETTPTARPQVAVTRVANPWTVLLIGAAMVFDFVRNGHFRPGAAAVATAAGVGLGTIRVVSGVRGLSVGFGIWGWPSRTISRDRIAAVTVENISPLRWGGWGYRMRAGGTRVIVRSGPAVVVELTNGRTFGVTVPDAENHAAVLAPSSTSSLN